MTTSSAATVTPLETTPLQYLDKAVQQIKGLGLWPETVEEAPVAALLEKIAHLDEEKALLIGRTLNQAGVFNELVREQVAAMNIGERYNEITDAFNSIRDDAKTMVSQLSDGRIDLMERITNSWMKLSRGDVGARFDKIRDTYLEVARDSKDQIEREHTILQAYLDFRGALKHAEVMALEILDIATDQLDAAKSRVEGAADLLANFSEGTPAERARLELARDEALRFMQNEEKRYQVAKDLSDNLTISYNTSEVVMARLVQTNSAKERIYQQAIAFFSTNESVLTALRASFSGLHGLHESTETLNAMKSGVEQSLETLAEIGDAVQESALRAGYGPTVGADSVKKLVDSVVNFQERSAEIIAEMRDLSTKNSSEIRDIVEDGKKRLTRLATRGNALLMDLDS